MANWQRLLVVAASLIAIVVPSLRAVADQVAVTSFPDTGYVSGLSGGITVGSKFQPLVDIQLTSLALWDQGANGFQAGHAIGVWDESLNLVASATMPAGSSTMLIGEFRYVPIAPVSLTAGKSYAIAAFYSPSAFDPLTGAITTFTSNANIGWLGSVEALNSGNALKYPETLWAEGQCFGPSFGFTVVPEPSSLTIMAIATLGLVAAARQRKRLACRR
jgi:hypothetical protein